MNTVLSLFGNLRNGLGCVGDLLGYLLRFASVFFQSRTSLAARLLAAESQLGMCTRRIEQKAQPKPRFTSGFRVLWVILSKFWAPWQAAAQLMQPATVKAWHTRAFKIYWRWKSRKKPGRPPITLEMRELIRKLALRPAASISLPRQRRHLWQGGREFLDSCGIEEYYHVSRPHQGLDGDTPIPQPKADAPITGPTKLISTPILGGLHHRYQRVAA
jgi:hypothetical protein